MKWNKKKGSLYEAASAAVLFLFLFVLCIIGMMLPLRKRYSNEEKRELKAFPKFSLGAVLKGSYFQDISEWYQDSYPGKEGWLSLEAKVEGLYGFQGEALYGEGKNVKESIPIEGELAETFSLEKDEEKSSKEKVPVEETLSAVDSENQNAETLKKVEKTGEESKESEKNQNFETDAEGNLEIKKADANVELQGETAGSIYLSGKEAFELYYFSEKGVRSYASLLNTVNSLYPNLEITAMMVPNSFGVLLDPKTQEKLASSGMDQAISYTYSLMDKRIHTIDVFSSLYKHRAEYIYFRTDHHWTQLGAYYAYVEYCKARGIKALALESFSKAEYDGFYGTFYFYMNRPEALKANPDSVIAYTGAVNDMHFQSADGKEGDAKLINDASNMLPGNKYNCFMLGDHPYVEIHNEKGDGNLLVIKDSYANAFVPFLAQDYRNVYVVDYRHYEKKLPELIRDKEIGEIVFVNNVMGIGESQSKKMLSLFQG